MRVDQPSRGAVDGKGRVRRPVGVGGLQREAQVWSELPAQPCFVTDSASGSGGPRGTEPSCW